MFTADRAPVREKFEYRELRRKSFFPEKKGKTGIEKKLRVLRKKASVPGK